MGSQEREGSVTMIHFNETIRRIDVWFDHQFKTWYVTEYNENGDQVGVSEDHYHKRDAVRAARRRVLALAGAPGLRIFTRAGGI